MINNKRDSVLKKGASSFTLVGTAKINDYSYSFNKKSKTSDWIYNTLNLGVNCGSGNIVYASMMGGYSSESEGFCYVYKKDTSGKADYNQSLKISFAERNNNQILDEIADECFIKIGLEKDLNGKIKTQKFLFSYDAIKYISENLENGAAVRVNGNLRYQYYPASEKISVNKNITSIYISSVEPQQYQATFIQKILIDKDSVQRADDEKNIIPVSAYTIEYVSKIGNIPIKQQLAFPILFEIEVNRENPDFTEKFINRFFKVRNNKFIDSIVVEGRIVESAVLETTDIKDLPDDIISLIECGQISEKDALSKYTKGQKCKKFIIDKPYIKSVSDPNDKENFTLSIVREENAYSQEDLVFVQDFLNDSGQSSEDSQNTQETKNTDDDWLKSLGL